MIGNFIPHILQIFAISDIITLDFLLFISEIMPNKPK